MSQTCLDLAPTTPDVVPAGPAAPPSDPANPPAEPQAFEAWLRERHPDTPVLYVLAGLAVAVFAATAVASGQLLHIDSAALVTWGAADATRVIGREPWRIGSSLFLHAGLTHLVGNLCFLLLAGRAAERLLGSAGFLGACLFAGVGGGLLSLGWFPTKVQLGASGVVMGVYGALVGCWLRGSDSLPRWTLARHVGLFMLLAGLMLFGDLMEREDSLVAHLGGALCGLLAGLVLGPWWRAKGLETERLRTFALVAGLATVVCFALAVWASHKPLALIAPYRTLLDRDRELDARFAAALERWEDGDLDDSGLARLLRDDLIPAWARARREGPSPLWMGGSVGPTLPELRRQREHRDRPRASRVPPSAEDVRGLLQLYGQARSESWAALAEGLGGAGLALDNVLDLLVVRMLREELDEMVNEVNPLRSWFEFSRAKLREKKREANRKGEPRHPLR